jgi:hypothetical protein
MKDLPHHVKKLNRRVIRSSHREAQAEEEYEMNQIPSPSPQRPKTQERKQAKSQMRRERLARIPSPMTPEERNRKMQERVPLFDRINNAKPKQAKPTRKKRPPI